MAHYRAQIGLAMLAPLLASAGCAGTAPCAFCDAGLTDTPIQQAEVLPAQEVGSAVDAMDDVTAAAGRIDSRPPATRDAPEGEAQQLAPIPDAGYKFIDDFVTGHAEGWQELGGRGTNGSPSEWAVILGDTGPVYSQGALDGNTWHLAYATTPLALDHFVEARLRVVDFFAATPSYMAALFVRYDSETDSGYFLALRADGSVIIRRRDHDVSASWGGSVARGIRSGVWYTVRLEVRDRTITAFIDGSQVYTVTDDSPLEGNHVGLGAFGATLEASYVLAAEI